MGGLDDETPADRIPSPLPGAFGRFVERRPVLTLLFVASLLALLVVLGESLPGPAPPAIPEW